MNLACISLSEYLKDILVQIWLQLESIYESEFPVGMYLAIENVL